MPVLHEISVLAFPLFASKEMNIDMAVALVTAGQPAGIWEWYNDRRCPVQRNGFYRVPISVFCRD